ncbi:F0F1 ATP synthase subunit gamma [Sulfurovum sp. bin170]|uniref:ATP synthase F1 subunit gamma n=1 Tax=Sulfurovum sp. bin170 TaxID=2695268 RepID=UPI0013DF213B|nr:ATP synthase F1 subunit gamma [Sulfurovum sp. bin170]NEW60448.1 F0F1 ATP synthase subunit gamma [Sulfurovum sp. bin170]
MANLKDIKRKISSVKGTQKTTRAMKLVSSAKLKRAEEVAKRSKTYASKLTELLSEIAQKMNQSEGEIDNVFFRENKNPSKVDIVFVSADKGLCGGFNYQTIKRTNKLLKEFDEAGVEVRLSGVGKKGIAFYKYNKREMINQIEGLSASPNYEDAAKFISELVEDYIAGKTDKIILVYNGYVNIITQEITQLQLLPVDMSNIELNVVSMSELEIEPDDDDTLMDALVRKYIEYSMYYGLLTSLAGEHSARMQAMDAATKNAGEMVQKLTVKYNKARQEAITTELIEIISGMESLK